MGLNAEQLKRKQERKAKIQSQKDKKLNQAKASQHSREVNKKPQKPLDINWNSPTPRPPNEDDPVFNYLKGKILPEFKLVKAELTYPTDLSMPRILLVMHLKHKKTKKNHEYKYNYNTIKWAIKNNTLNEWEEESAKNG